MFVKVKGWPSAAYFVTPSICFADNDAPAPGGGGEQTQPIGPLGMGAAALVLAELDEPTEPPADAGEAAPAGEGGDQQDDQETPTEGAEAKAEEDAETEETAPVEGAEPAEDAEPEPEPEADQYVHGNARTRLSDGTVTTVGELKKLADEGREYRAKLPEFNAAQEQLRQMQERLAQYAPIEQFVQRDLPAILQAIETKTIPPAPDPALLDETSPSFDPVKYGIDRDRRQLAIEQHQQLVATARQAQQDQQRQQDEARAAEAKAKAEAGAKYLLEKIPDFADQEKGKAIFDKMVQDAEKFGITREDILAADAKAIHMFHVLRSKAEAYDRLMAQKPRVAAKVERAVPVQQPGARVSQAASAEQALGEKFEKWRKSGGGMAGAAEILAALD